MGDHYGFSLTTFSPSGKLMQIEYALNAVKNGQPSVGLRAADGVVLATENITSVLYEDQPKIEQISRHIGCIYSGMGPDFRILVSRARKIAVEYELAYGEEIPTTQLVSKLAAVMQEYTQSGGVRPFGVSLLIAGWDKEPARPLLFQADPSGAYFAWKATALGKNDVNAKTFLEKRFNETLELDDGIHTALLTLRFDFFQTDESVTVTILKRGVELSTCKVLYNESRLSVLVSDALVFEEELEGPIHADRIVLKCTPSKIELTLPKATFGRWPQLVRSASESAPSTASASKKDWDKLEKQAVKEEEDEQLSGDAAVNRLFQKIYRDADDDTRRAMIKSYQESAGTVLSTNWNEIKQKKTEIKPPDSMEFKRYDQ